MDAERCRGVVGMNDCIRERAGSIGYNEAGIGWSSGLQEISIKNKYGRLLTSKQAAANGGIGAKEIGVLPEEPTADFADVSLLDQEGEFTWPITLLTYVNVRGDITFMKDHAERALLVAFIKALYDPSFVEPCSTKFGFFLADGPALKLARKAITILEASLDPDQPNWTFETTAEALVGDQNYDYILSENRRNIPALERQLNSDDVEALHEIVADLQRQVLLLTTELEEANRRDDNGGEVEFTAKYEAMILAGLIMGAVALVFVLGLAAVVMATKPAAVVDDKHGQN
jgi:hypothetical protein